MLKRKKPEASLPRDADTLMALYDMQQDSWEKRRIIEKAYALYPDDLRVCRALLMLGGLGTRPRGTLDYSLIKCYVLRVFEKPEEYTDEERQEKAREIFDHPLLKHCLELCPDEEHAQAFLRSYAEELTGSYAHLFIEGASEHSGSLLGFSTLRSRQKARSVPFAALLTGIAGSGALGRQEKDLLLQCVWRDAKGLLQGDTALLTEKLTPELMAWLNRES